MIKIKCPSCKSVVFVEREAVAARWTCPTCSCSWKVTRKTRVVEQERLTAAPSPGAREPDALDRFLASLWLGWKASKTLFFIGALNLLAAFITNARFDDLEAGYGQMKRDRTWVYIMASGGAAFVGLGWVAKAVEAQGKR